MAYEDIQIAIPGQDVSASMFGIKVRDAILDLDRRSFALEQQQQRILARGSRSTSRAGITNTEGGIIRIDDIPVLFGYMYRISSGSVAWDLTAGALPTTMGGGPPSVALVHAQTNLRVAHSASPGTPATTSSTPINRTRTPIIDSEVGPIVNISEFYIPPSDGYISVLLSGLRWGSVGTLQVYADSTNPLNLTVEFGGVDPGNTGIAL